MRAEGPSPEVVGGPRRNGCKEPPHANGTMAMRVRAPKHPRGGHRANSDRRSAPPSLMVSSRLLVGRLSPSQQPCEIHTNKSACKSLHRTPDGGSVTCTVASRHAAADPGSPLWRHTRKPAPRGRTQHDERCHPTGARRDEVIAARREAGTNAFPDGRGCGAAAIGAKWRPGRILSSPGNATRPVLPLPGATNVVTRVAPRSS